MASSNIVKRKRGGDYCVAGGPNKVSCKNSSYSEGISMHCFPKDEIVREKMDKFCSKNTEKTSCHQTSRVYVRRTLMKTVMRTGQFPSLISQIWSKPPRFKRYLIKGSVPTKDVAGRTPEMPKTPSARQRRQVSTLMFLIFILFFIKLYEALKHVCGVEAGRKFSKGSLSYINDM